jgi:hypothetical protein
MTADRRFRPLEQGRCTGTIALGEWLSRSLANRLSRDGLPDSYCCALGSEHRGAHHAAIDRGGNEPYWFRWDEWGIRIGADNHGSRPNRGAERPPWIRHRRSAGLADEVSDAPTMLIPPVRVDSYAPRGSARNPVPSPSHTEALWALVAAINGLADSITRTNDGTR